MTELRTERLVLRPIARADLADLHRLWTDPEVRRFLFDDRVLSEAEARELVEASEQGFRDRGLGIWAVAHLSDPADCVGFAGFLLHETEPSLVYGVRGAEAGRGVATEAASAVVSHAMQEGGVRLMVADVDEPNVASVRVLEKLGMTRTRRAVVNGAPLLYFELARVEPNGA